MAELILTTFDWVPEMPRGYVRDIRVRWALESRTDQRQLLLPAVLPQMRMLPECLIYFALTSFLS